MIPEGAAVQPASTAWPALGFQPHNIYLILINNSQSKDKD
jgi:hypothetical protein